MFPEAALHFYYIYCIFTSETDFVNDMQSAFSCLKDQSDVVPTCAKDT